MFSGDVQFSRKAISEDIYRDLDIYLWSVRWNLPLSLSRYRRLTKGKPNPAEHMGPYGNQVVMEQRQHSRDFGKLVIADLKLSTQRQKSVKKT